VVDNPMRDTLPPRGYQPGYSRLYTGRKSTPCLPSYRTSRTLVLVAALTGLGAAELKGLRGKISRATNL